MPFFASKCQVLTKDDKATIYSDTTEDMAGGEGYLIESEVPTSYLTCIEQPVLRGLSTTGKMCCTRWSIGVWQVDSRCDSCMNLRRAGSLLTGQNLAIQASTVSRSTSRSSASKRAYSTGVSRRIITFGATMSDADVKCVSRVASMHEFALGLL